MTKSPEQLRSLGILGSRTAHLDNRNLSEDQPQEIVESPKRALKMGIKNPNSSGQGMHPDFQKHPYHKLFGQAGFKYSHTTPVSDMHGKFTLRHSYKKVSDPKQQAAAMVFLKTGKWAWHLSEQASGKEASGDNPRDLVKALKNQIRRAKGGKKEGGGNQDPPVITMLRKIVKHHQFAKVPDPATGKKVSVDVTTAHAVLTVYDNLKDPKNRETYVKMPLLKMANTAFKLLKKGSKKEAATISFKSMLQKVGFKPSDSTYKFHGKVVKFLNKLKDDRNRSLLAKMWSNLRKSEGKKGGSPWSVKKPLPVGQTGDAWVVSPSGDKKKVKNLGWFIKKANTTKIKRIVVTHKGKVVRAVFDDGYHYFAQFASPEALKSFLSSKLLKGVLVLSEKQESLTEAQVQEITEGLYDPHILKAVFIAGGPGSGKSFYTNKLFAGTGVKVVNSDNQFERLMAQAGLSLKTQVGGAKAQGELRPKAKAVTAAKLNSLSNERLGVVVEGTSKRPAEILKLRKRLESLGYDTSMVLINTSLDVAKKRNQTRDRTLPEKAVVDGWHAVQEAAKKYRGTFGKNFHEIDGNAFFSDAEVKSKLIPKMNNLGTKILKAKLRNPKGWGWLVKTATALGITDPRKVTHLGKVGMSKAKSLAGSKAESLNEAGAPKVRGMPWKVDRNWSARQIVSTVLRSELIAASKKEPNPNALDHFLMASDKIKKSVPDKKDVAAMKKLKAEVKDAFFLPLTRFYKWLDAVIAFKQQSKGESLNESELVHMPSASDTKGRERKSSKVGYIVKDNVFQPVGPIEKAETLEPGIYEIQSSMSGPYFEVTSVTTDALLRFKDSRYNETLNEISKFWKLKEKYADMGFPHKRGVLLYGPPGTGKSCLLKMVIEEMVGDGNIVLKTRSPGTLMTGLKALREIEKDRKVLCILEDVDELCRYNEHSILQLFDGDSTVDNVCYLATTNYIERLPPRILRSGRFDRKVKVVAPPKEGRMAYYQAKLGLNENGNELKEIVDLTDGFTFAEMKEFLVSTYILDIPAKTAAHRIRTGLEESVHSPEAMTEMVEGLAMKKLKR